jgi:mono/diheme cytochrome c family protein
LFNTSPLNNPIAKPDIDLLIQRVALQILALLLVVVLASIGVSHLSESDPYIHTVLSLKGDPARGAAIFQMNCAGCHGANASGHVGPSLLKISGHKSRVSLIEQVISGQTPPMPQFQPSPEIMADLLEYLETL